MQNSSDGKNTTGTHSSGSEVFYASSSDSNQRRSIAPLPLDEAELMFVPSVQEAAAPISEEAPPEAAAAAKDADNEADNLFNGLPVKINPEPSFAQLSEIPEGDDTDPENSESYWMGFYQGLEATRLNQEDSPKTENSGGASPSPDGLKAGAPEAEAAASEATAADKDETVFNNPGSGRTVSSSSEYTVTRDPNKAENALTENSPAPKSKKNASDPQQGKIISFLSFVNKKQSKETKKLTAEEQLDNLQKEAKAEEEKLKTPPDYFKLVVHVTFVICVFLIFILMCLTYFWPDYLAALYISPAAAQAVLMALMLYLTFDISCQVEPGNFRKALLFMGLLIITELAVLLKYI